MCPVHSAELAVALDGRLVGSYIKIKKYPEHASSEHKMHVKATARPLYVLDQSYINSEKFRSQLRFLCGNRKCTLRKNNVFVYDIDGTRFIMFLTIYFLAFMPLDFVNDVTGIFRVIT